MRSRSATGTDLIVVSDHGFATIKFRVVLSEMLVSAGVNKLHDSTDIIVVPNGGADLDLSLASRFSHDGIAARGAPEYCRLRRGAGMVRPDLLARTRNLL